MNAVLYSDDPFQMFIHFRSWVLLKEKKNDSFYKSYTTSVITSKVHIYKLSYSL